MQKPLETDEKEYIGTGEQTTIVATDAADPYIGKVIGDKYEVESLLGRGGMGSVYKVLHRQLKKQLALKILPQSNGLDRVDIARFDAEAKAASMLHHPNLAGIHDYGSAEDGSPYLVMDYIDGESLSDMIKRDGAIEPEQAVDIFLQVCSGLEFAHGKRLVHRDIKPSNIMVSKDSGKVVARVVDFGIAKKLPMADEHNPTLTGTGEIVGSPQYMSPEQCMGYKLDVRSDIYSLGCVMFEALTGKPAFAAENAVQVIFKHLNERAPLFKSAAPNCKVSSGLERVVHQALEKEPDNRYQNVSDLKRDLELVKDGKNPIKEVSRLRNNLRTLGRIGKMCAWATACVAVTLFAVWLAYTSLVHSTPWGDCAAGAQEDLKHFNYNVAESKYRQALAIAAKEHAPADDREQMIFELATIYSETGQTHKAVQCLNDGLKISETQPLTWRKGQLLDELAATYLKMENYKLAEDAARQAVEIKEATRGKIDALTAHSVSRLAQALRHQGRLEEAEKQARKYVSIETKLHPDGGDPELAHSYHVLSDILADEGVGGKTDKINDAIVNGQLSLNAYIKSLGADHPDTQEYARWYVDYLRYWHHDTEAAQAAKAANIPLSVSASDNK